MSKYDAQAVTLSPMVVGSTRDGTFAEAGGATLWSLIDNRLRGRWKPAIVVAFVLGTVFGIAGYLFTTPKYESAGLIRIAPNISPILRATPETGLMPLYHNFVQTQVHLIRSQLVLERALEDEILSELPWTQQPNALRRLKKGLVVKADRASELITVGFRAESAEVAQVAVNAVIKAYDEKYASVGGDEIGRKLRTLRERRTELRRQRNETLNAVQQFVGETAYGDSALGQLLIAKMMRREKIASDVEELEQLLVLTEATSSEAPDDAAEGGAAPTAPTAAQLDMFDPQLAELRRFQDALWLRFELIKHRWRPTHPEYSRLELRLQAAEQMVQEREAIARAELEGAGIQSLLGAAGPIGTGTREQLEAELETLKRQARRSHEQIRQLSADGQRSQELRAEVNDIEQDLSEINNRIKYLEIESESVRTGRISISAYGDRPLGPARDRRRQTAAVGVIGGLGLGFGLFFLLGTVDRRAYDSAQLRDEGIGLRCVGVVPDLGRHFLDPGSCVVAAHCMHQIRNHIEVVRKPSSGFVLAVTSPYQGDGKTSIVIALGWSYAAAGNRTVLVDCDLVGQSLTRQMGLGDQVGLKEALREIRSNGQVVPLRIPNVSVLPAGVDPSVGAEVIRKGDLEAVFQHLRKEFDVIVVDTGPMLGSLEGLPVASAADGVLLSIRRGRRRPRLEECVQHLESVGASCLGVVLNWAARADCNRYVARSSLSTLHAEKETDDSGQAAGALGNSDAATDDQNALVRAMKIASRHSTRDDEPREMG